MELELVVFGVVMLMFNLGNDLEIIFGDSVVLFFVMNVVVDFIIWDVDFMLSCLDCDKLVVCFISMIMYMVIIVDVNGCLVMDKIVVEVDWVFGVYILQVFFLNGDGVNDCFFINVGVGVSRILNFQVYDCWGSIFFLEVNFLFNDLSISWDGKYKG